MSREPFFDELADEFSRLIRQRHYHQQQEDPEATATLQAIPAAPAAAGPISITATTITATPAPEEEVMAAIATLEDDAAKLRAEVEAFVTSKLPAATGDLKKLEALADNPVVLSLLSAVHVPTEALAMAVKVIDGLEELYKPETAVAAPSEPAPSSVPETPAEAAPAV